MSRYVKAEKLLDKIIFIPFHFNFDFKIENSSSVSSMIRFSWHQSEIRSMHHVILIINIFLFDAIRFIKVL